MKKHRILAAFLAFILMAAMLIVGCQNETENPSDGTTGNVTQGTGTSDTETEGVTTEFAYPEIPEGADHSGKIFTLYTWPVHSPDYYMIEEESSEPVEQAAYNRFRNVEGKLDIEIDRMCEPQWNVAQENFMLMTSSGEELCNMYVAQSVYLQLNLASAGLLYNWNDLNCDYTQPYWNQTVIENLTVGDVLLGMHSDFVQTNVNALAFNKDILIDEEIPLPYDQVKNGTWTLDAFLNITKNLSKDMNGDGVMDGNDRYAWRFAYRDYLTSFMYGADIQAVTIVDDEAVIFNDLEKLGTAIEKVHQLIYNDGRTIPVFEGDQAILFENGGCVFDLRCVSSHMRDIEFNYGFLPMPKYDEKQEEYYTNTYAELMLLPITLSDPAFTGLVIEMLSAESRLEFLPAYIDTMMQQKVARDPEDAEILMDLYNHIVWEFGYVYANWNNISFTFPWMMRDNTTNVNAWYDAYAPAFQSQLDQLLDKMDSAY